MNESDSLWQPVAVERTPPVHPALSPNVTAVHYYNFHRALNASPKHAYSARAAPASVGRQDAPSVKGSSGELR